MSYLPTGTALRQRRGIPTHNDGAVVIHTGLSVVTACGHIVDIVRDPATKTATVCVKALAYIVPGSDQCDLVQAANMLAERARRFFGTEWTVVPWTPAPDPALKTAGHIPQTIHI